MSTAEQETGPKEDSWASSQRGSSDEQEQGLLGEWKATETDEEEVELDDLELAEVAAHSQPRRRPSWRTWVLVVGAAILAIIVAAALPLLFYSPDGSDVSEAAEVQTNDYLLDPDWDFHAAPRQREYTWTVRDHHHNPDGVYRPMILVNGQFPGPLIEVNEGDTVVVHIDNQAANATSIHWHGIYQNGTSHMDGTVGISQCPIAPGTSFTYRFNVSGQSGTYWWHAHQGAQSSDGLHGPLVVHSRREKELQQLQYTTDRVVLVSDHYHDLSSSLMWQYLKPDMENTEPVAQSALINGRSVRDCDDFPERNCNNTTANVALPTFHLPPGQNHRLRFINVGAFAEFQLQIDEHELAVTEVDGTDVEPIRYHRVNINAAQRYSAVIEAKKDHGLDSVWLRARMIAKCFTDPPKTLQSEVRAIVALKPQKSSSSDDESAPTSTDWDEKLDLECRDMNTTDLMPVEKIPAPAEADAFFYLRSNFEIGAYRLSRGFFNGSSWRPNLHSPSLLRAVDGLSSDNDSFASGSVSTPATNTTTTTTTTTTAASSAAFVNAAAFDPARELVIQSTGIQTIDILISNFDDGNHPVHLHGYKYFVLGQGHGYPPLTSVGADITRPNLAPLYSALDLSNPLRRDTASVEAFGWILLRVVADNPGAWAFHCHVTWHAEAGLLMQFLTRTDELRHAKVPKENVELCARRGLERGKGPDDEDYYDLAKD